MPTIINGNTGVDQVAPNSVDFADLKNTLFNGLLSANGYVKIPVRDQGVERELIIQWGTKDYSGSSQNIDIPVTFQISFPSACLAVSVTRNSAVTLPGTGVDGFAARSYTTSGFQFQFEMTTGTTAGVGSTISYIAIGY